MRSSGPWLELVGRVVASPVRGGWSVRLRCGPKLHPRLRMPAMPRPAALERERRLRAMATQLHRARRDDALETLMEAAAAETEQAFADVECEVGALTVARSRSPKTFRDVLELWTSGELHRRYPDRVAAKVSAKLDRSRAAVLCETIGDVPLRRFTVDSAERALAKLPRRARMRSTRRQYAQIIARALKLAVFPLRVIEHSPLPAGWIPRASTRRAFTFLYPSEDRQLMKCADIPLERRLLYGVLAREGLRMSEALCLTWDALDTTLGVIRLDRNKTNRPRAWRLGADVSRALLSWGKSHRGLQGATVFNATTIDRVAAARIFRSDLQLAGIKRSELYDRSDQRSPIRVHDLRGTFVTLALADGWTEAEVMDRTGHTTSSMLNAYRRLARHASELELGWFGPLDELLGLCRGVRKTAGKSPKARAGQSSSNPHQRRALRKNATKTSLATPEHVTPSPTGTAGSEELSRALELLLAGDWAALAALAAERTNTTDAPARVKPTRRR